MKKRLIPIACAVTVALLSASSARAYSTTPNEVAADCLLVRPVAFLGTVLGSVVFVVTLPFTAPAHGVQTAAKNLVVAPARYTFTRPVGDLDTWDVEDF